MGRAILTHRDQVALAALWQPELHAAAGTRPVALDCTAQVLREAGVAAEAAAPSDNILEVRHPPIGTYTPPKPHLHLSPEEVGGYAEYEPSMDNPYDAGKINAILDDIRDHGIRHPIDLNTDGTHATISDGYHRWWAARHLGHDQVPVRINPVPSWFYEDSGDSNPVGPALADWLGQHGHEVGLRRTAEYFKADEFRALGRAYLERNPHLKPLADEFDRRHGAHRQVSIPISVLKNYYVSDDNDLVDDDGSSASYLQGIQNTLRDHGWEAFKNYPALEVGAGGQHAVLSDGNHRVRAADALGMTHAPVNLVTGEDDNWARQYGRPVEDGLRRLLGHRFAGLHDDWQNAWETGGSQGQFPVWFENGSAYGNKAYEAFSNWLDTVDDDEWDDWENGGWGPSYGPSQESFEDYLDATGIPHTDAHDFEDDPDFEDDEDDRYEDPRPLYDPREDERPIIPHSDDRRYYSPRAINPESNSSARPDPDFEDVEPEQDFLPLGDSGKASDPYAYGMPNGVSGMYYPPSNPEFRDWVHNTYGVDTVNDEWPDHFERADRPYVKQKWPGVVDDFLQSQKDYQWPTEKRTPLYRGLSLNLNDPDLAQVRRSLLGGEYEDDDFYRKNAQPHPLGYTNPELGPQILDYLESRDKSYAPGLGPAALGPHWSTDRSVSSDSFSGRQNKNPLSLPVLISGEWGGLGEDPYRANTGGSYPEEHEITLLPGAPLNITNVQIAHPQTGQWHSVLDQPHERTASLERVGGTDFEEPDTLVLYHGTTADCLDGIRSTGLTPPSTVNPAGWPMLTTSFDQAARYTSGKPGGVVLEYGVPRSRMWESRFDSEDEPLLWPGDIHSAYEYPDAVGYGIKGALPQEYLRKVHHLNTERTASG